MVQTALVPIGCKYKFSPLGRLKCGGVKVHPSYIPPLKVEGEEIRNAVLREAVAQPSQEVRLCAPGRWEGILQGYFKELNCLKKIIVSFDIELTMGFDSCDGEGR